MSLTPREETEEPSSPSCTTHPHSLSPGRKYYWAQAAPEAKAAEDASTTDKEGDQESFMMSYKNSDSQSALNDLTHYEILAQLRKTSNSASLLDHLNHNGTAAVYHQGSRNDELPPAIWSPGAQHRSPEGADAGSTQQACPFCHRVYQRRTSLRDHIKCCQERGGVHIVCPQCGYTATIREEMERHLAFHKQIQGPIVLDQGMENRKFKCLQCGKAFKYKHHLKEHVRIHSGEKPYKCSNCKKRFSHSGSYSSHLSSKKCLSGGGNGGGIMGRASGAINGHSQNSNYCSFLMSPSAGRGTNSNEKGSLLASQNQDNTRSLSQVPENSQQLSLQDPNQNPTAFSRASDLAQLWDPSAEPSLRASILNGNTLLPFPYPRIEFEQMLQEMLHREVKKDEEIDGREGSAAEKSRVIHNGGDPDSKMSPVRRRESVTSGEVERAVLGVTCHWCSQLFPNMAVLLQHERYLCKMNREAVEVPESLHSKDHPSSPLFFPGSALQPENHKRSEVTNGLSGNKSPLQKPSWHSVPHQLLVVMHSPPQPHHDALSSRSYWPGHEKGSPSQPINHSPELSSPQARRRAPSSRFGSPVCLDLTSCPPELSSPQTSSPWSAQDEPLDLSLPKQFSDQEGRHKTVNGNSSKGERRELGTQQLKRPSPTLHLSLHHHPTYSGTRTPMFQRSLSLGFPVFNQSGLGISGHEGIIPVPFGQSANSTGYLSPMAYMMEADTEATLKKIQQERQALMGDVLNCGALDYLTLMDEGLEGEGGPGRKRLRKTEEGLYACDICEKTFQKSSSLLRHKYEHTGKRPHECKICNKAFKHKHHLIEHSRLHSGEKPYQCDKCGKRFSHSGSYSQHMNHRYAYCSKDQDPDQDHEEMPFTPGPGITFKTDETPLSMEDAQTPHSFLSDSSFEGAPETLKEEEEEEEEKEAEVSDGHVEEAHVSLSGEQLEISPWKAT